MKIPDNDVKRRTVTERDEPQHSEERNADEVDEQELLRARKRHLSKRLRSRGLIVGDPDHPVDEQAEEELPGV